MKNLLILILLLSNICAADIDVKPINQGEVAPYAGFLFTPDAAKNVHNKLLDLDYQTKTNQNLQLEIVDYEKRLQNYRTENDALSQRLSKSDTSFFEKTGFFLLGAFITGGLAYGIYRTK